MKTKEHSLCEPKSFLRWAGGKSWLVKHVKDSIQSLRFRNYHEPFLGGGSLYFSLLPSKGVYLSDLNVELIETYEVVRDNVTRLINELDKYKNTKTFYYSIRDQISESKIRRAARFIFLNQTSFNGIYRVNLKGNYNVPYGFRSKNFLDEQNLRAASKALKGVVLSSGDFMDSLKRVKKDDLVFLDPPYTVSHNHNGFIKYNQKLFSLEDQYRLRAYIDGIRQKGAYFILANAAHATVSDIFGQNSKRHEVSRASLIGGVNAKRGPISEYLFSNIPNLI